MSFGVPRLCTIPNRAIMLLMLLGIIVATVSPIALTTFAQNSLPTVLYDQSKHAISIGNFYDPDDPGQAAFIGYPSHPNAPKQPISIPQLAMALTMLGLQDLLIDQGAGNWLLKADLIVYPSARLEATAET